MDLSNKISLLQCADIIASTPSVRFFLQGEPGIGKSFLIKELANRLPGYETAYIDVGNIDLGDIAMPVVNKETGTTSYFPNEIFKLHLGKPVIIMLDEFSKGSQAVKNMLHPLLEAHNPRLGNVRIHPDTIIFATGNNVMDGVGDSIKAHTLNRLTVVNVRKPTADEWINWGINNGIDEAVLAWIREFPHALASYQEEGQDGNPYIFNPRKAQIEAFVSPRSLELASNIVKKRKFFDADTLLSALAGTVGKQAAIDMEAFIQFKDELPNFDDVVKNPMETKIPKMLGPKYVFVYSSITRITNENLKPVMDYLGRFEVEFLALFAVCLTRVQSKRQICLENPAFEKFVKDNLDII